MGHPLGGVPRAKGLLWHSLGIIVAIGGFVLAQGRGTWASDGERMGVTRGQWQGLAVSPPSIHTTRGVLVALGLLRQSHS